MFDYCQNCGTPNDYGAKECKKCKKSLAISSPIKESKEIKVNPPVKVDKSDAMKVGDFIISKSNVEENLRKLGSIGEDEIKVESNTSNLLQEITKK